MGEHECAHADITPRESKTYNNKPWMISSAFAYVYFKVVTIMSILTSDDMEIKLLLSKNPTGFHDFSITLQKKLYNTLKGNQNHKRMLNI